MTFLVESIQKKFTPSDHKYCEVIGLLGDIAKNMKEYDLKQYYEAQAVQDIIIHGKTLQGEEPQNTVEWAENQIKALF